MTATPPISGNCDGARLSRIGSMPLLIVLTVAVSGCNLVPSMGARKHRVDPDEEARLSAIAYQEILATHPLSQDAASIQLVQQVGQRLARASGRTDIRWDFKLVEDNSPRATALPGGRVVVADSVLGVCRNEAQLAAVIAAAMGRQLAENALVRKSASASEHAALADTSSPEARQTAPSVEADSIALSVLVAAGYDPDAAQQMWFGSQAADASATGTAQSRTSRQGSFQLALDRARFIYRSHSQPLGFGNPIAWSPRFSPQPGPTPANQEIWTAAVNRGAAKPSDWNADLNGEPEPLTTVASREHDTGIAPAGEEFLPPTTGQAIQPAVYEWSSADATLVPRATNSDPQIEFVQPAAFEPTDSSTTPATLLPGPMLP